MQNAKRKTVIDADDLSLFRNSSHVRRYLYARCGAIYIWVLSLFHARRSAYCFLHGWLEEWVRMDLFVGRSKLSPAQPRDMHCSIHLGHIRVYCFVRSPLTFQYHLRFSFLYNNAVILSAIPRNGMIISRKVITKPRFEDPFCSCSMKDTHRMLWAEPERVGKTIRNPNSRHRRQDNPWRVVPRKRELKQKTRNPERMMKSHKHQQILGSNLSSEKQSVSALGGILAMIHDRYEEFVKSRMKAVHISAACTRIIPSCPLLARRCTVVEKAKNKDIPTSPAPRYLCLWSVLHNSLVMNSFLVYWRLNGISQFL